MFLYDIEQIGHFTKGRFSTGNVAGTSINSTSSKGMPKLFANLSGSPIVADIITTLFFAILLNKSVVNNSIVTGFNSKPVIAPFAVL